MLCRFDSAISTSILSAVLLLIRRLANGTVGIVTLANPWKHLHKHHAYAFVTVLLFSLFYSEH